MSYTRKSKSQRQLRVGERIRRILSDLFLRGNFTDPVLRKSMITVTEVVPSPDLKHATAYVSALGEDQDPELVEHLNESSQELSYEVAQKLTTKFSPKLSFEYDTSFEEAQRIEELLEDID